MTSRKSFAIAAASTFLLAGCGASNVVGTALGVNEIIEQSNPPATSINVLPEDITEDQGSDNSVAAQRQALTALFGTGFFLHGFTGDDRVYLYETPFNANTLVELNPDVLGLDSTGTLSWSEDGGETVTTEGTAPFRCLFIDSVDLYLCNAILSNGFTDNFLLQPLANGESNGNYEYCENTITTEDCVDSLINEPDGGVRLTISTASATSHTSVAIETNSGNLSEVVSEKSYLEQGTIGYNVNRGIDTQRTSANAVIEQARNLLLSQ